MRVNRHIAIHAPLIKTSTRNTELSKLTGSTFAADFTAFSCGFNRQFNSRPVVSQSNNEDDAKPETFLELGARLTFGRDQADDACTLLAGLELLFAHLNEQHAEIPENPFSQLLIVRILTGNREKHTLSITVSEKMQKALGELNTAELTRVEQAASTVGPVLQKEKYGAGSVQVAKKAQRFSITLASHEDEKSANICPNKRSVLLSGSAAEVLVFLAAFAKLSTISQAYTQTTQPAAAG